MLSILLNIMNEQKSSCAQVYRKLEDCLADNDRNWSACQEQVKALKECYKRATLAASPHTLKYS